MGREEVLETEYAQMIKYYDEKYTESELVNDHAAESPHAQQIDLNDKKGGALATGFCY